MRKVNLIFYDINAMKKNFSYIEAVILLFRVTNILGILMKFPRFLRLFEILLLISTILLITWLAVYPLLQLYFWRTINIAREVDPEYLNGLLTASSILFGFISMALIEGNMEDKRVWIMFVISLFMIIRAGISLFQVIIGNTASMEAAVWLYASFQVNAAVSMYIVGYMLSLIHI